MLRLTEMTKDYQAGETVVHALKGINIDFRRSEFVAVLGPSGCGKTTLMNIIGGLDRATSGDLLINGKSTLSFKDSEWDNYRNKKIGFVFQNYYLIPHLPILANVELALTIAGISKAERTKRATEALQKVGLHDQIHKKPNQLSGGQMQRVAIARALVNSPEILLADEPTGALDTKTSEQILNLIREISADKLVIMVTHNSELADAYATRIVRMVDGVVVSDSMPYDCDADPVFRNEVEQLKAEEAIKKSNKEKKIKPAQGKNRTAMSFLTALSLSLRNLLSKKGRTILTSIAGSIGIIGIALILAISSGMNSYVNKMITDTMSQNPLTISETTLNLEQLMSASGGSTVTMEKFPTIAKIFTKEEKPRSMTTKNNITAEYLQYLSDNIKAEWYNDIIYTTGMTMEYYTVKPGETEYSKLTTTNQWYQLLKNEFLLTQYDPIAGRLPEAADEIVIIVDEYNNISQTTLINLGLKKQDDGVVEYTFEQVMAKTYKILPNNEIYEEVGGLFRLKPTADINFDNALDLKITGVVRINQYTDAGVLSPGIGYTKALVSWLQDENGKSDIVQRMIDDPTHDPITGNEYKDYQQGSNFVSAASQRTTQMRTLGGVTQPNGISIYPVSYDTKESIKNVLKDYNAGKSEEDSVVFYDLAEIMGAMINRMVNTITYVLIGFTAISLIVSCVMIAIITYISVIERTKEIGILRSIGARKKDITRVFNAETFIIGFCAGSIGVIVSYLLSIPINIIIKALTGVAGIASLSPLSAVILIAISVVLTLLSGLVPARMAAKKDPVLALRTD